MNCILKQLSWGKDGVLLLRPFLYFGYKYITEALKSVNEPPPPTSPGFGIVCLGDSGERLPTSHKFANLSASVKPV